jgi:hypothetical protein
LGLVCAYSSVGVGSCDLANGDALKRGVESLSHEDGAGDGQVGLAGDQRRTSKVGGSSNALEDAGKTKETVDILVGEGVFASGVGGNTSGGQGTREKLDVLLLIVSDVLEVLVVLGALSCAIVSVKSSMACSCKEAITYRRPRSPSRRTWREHPCRRRSRGVQE